MTKQLSNQKAEAKSDVKGASPAFSVASQRSRADDLAVLARNEKFIREAYRLAEIKDIPGWVACFNDEGTFTNEAAGITYRGPNEVGRPVEIFAQAFPDMHRELYNVYATGDLVVVELSLNGRNTGPLEQPNGTVPPTGKRMKAPCCDVFRLKNGKIQSFDCYPIITEASWLPD
jgi:ketosteroid isomerase-like protein